MRRVRAHSATIGLAVVALMVSPRATLADPVEIWSDGFESGDFGAWTGVVGNWSVVNSMLAAHSGTHGGDVGGLSPGEGDSLALAISSQNYEVLEWEYWWKVRETLEGGDQVLAQWTADGGLVWQTLASYANLAPGDWQMALFNLPPGADHNPDLGFRLWSGFNAASDRVAFDDFVLRGQVVPEPSGFTCLTGVLAMISRRRRHH